MGKMNDKTLSREGQGFAYSKTAAMALHLIYRTQQMKKIIYSGNKQKYTAWAFMVKCPSCISAQMDHFYELS